MSPKLASCIAVILFLLVSSNSPENAVTTSFLEHFFRVNNLLNTNFCFLTNSFNICFTLLVTVILSIIAIFSILVAF